ncbi:hypothetical protein BC830DRAFT_596216 [Chytriomyces sp. MP71]|nr:hypothetical protein BC830DRAFT_596216 [Chytriomyces sp. MP71]
MEYLMQWCLVCERRLEHQGLYCSPACLSLDFAGVAPTTLDTSSMAHSSVPTSPLQSATSTNHIKRAQPRSDAASKPKAPPSRQRSFSIDDAAAHSAEKVRVQQNSLLLPFQARVQEQATGLRAVSSAPSGGSRTRRGPADAVQMLQQHILAPAFSLGFQSRRERAGWLRGNGDSLKGDEGKSVPRDSTGTLVDCGNGGDGVE